MELTVADAAQRMGVSQRRVRQLAEDGRVAGRRIGRAWVVDEASLHARRRSRPMSQRVAWAFIDVLEGGPGDGVSRSEKYRLREKRESLSRRFDVDILRSWLAGRAELSEYRLDPADLPDLLRDVRVVPSGVSDPRSDLSAGGDAEGYVSHADLRVLVREYLLVHDERPNVRMHVSDRVLPRPAPLAVVAVDLADRGGPRERRAAQRMLRSLLVS